MCLPGTVLDGGGVRGAMAERQTCCLPFWNCGLLEETDKES